MSTIIYASAGAGGGLIIGLAGLAIFLSRQGRLVTPFTPPGAGLGLQAHLTSKRLLEKSVFPRKHARMLRMHDGRNG